MSTGEDLGTVLAGLERASRHRLAEHWAEYFGAVPLPRTSRSLMIRAVAYKMRNGNWAGSRLQPAACCAGRDRLRFGAGERLARAPCWSASGTGSGIRSRSSKRACSIAVTLELPNPEGRCAHH